MTKRHVDRQLAVASAALLPLLVGAALVGVRDIFGAPALALAVGLTVVVGARIGGRLGGCAAAVTAALAFDFFLTAPTLSLKITNRDDIVATALLLAVGLAVGTIAGKADADSHHAENTKVATASLARVIGVVDNGSVEDVEMSVRAELLDVLTLQECWFTPDPVSLPELGPKGALDTRSYRMARDGFELPREGIAIPVETQGHRFGELVCIPVPGSGVSIERRRVAAALAHLLALAKGATPSPS